MDQSPLNEEISLSKIKGYSGESLKGVSKQFQVVNTFVNLENSEKVVPVTNLELVYTNDTKNTIKELNDDCMEIIKSKKEFVEKLKDIEISKNK